MSTVQFLYDGDDITGSVLFRTASFESQLGAQPGQFAITLKDPTQILSFVTGKELQVYIDGALYFGGFVLQVTKTFGFPVDRVDDGAAAVKTRMWELRGSDYNILFDRRYTYNKATPDHVIAAAPASYTDAQVINLMCSSYLDLTDVDYVTNVEAVGDPTPDVGEAYGFIGVGTPWRKEMKEISARTGAIWYIAPDKSLHYKDRELTTPGWGFSDTPNNVDTFGFREIQMIEDATNLGNDALVWGGSEFGITGTTAEMVFGRATDNTSIANFFRSQIAEARFGQLISDLACQNRANVIVYGDPGGALGDLADTNRGLQNPQRYIRLAWFGDGIPSPLIPGTVVTTYLSVFGETMTLPVRSIRITFESPEIARFDGYFGVQTDDPFTLWKYMKKVADQGGTGSAGGGVGGSSLLQPVSDGSSPALVAGTEVCMSPSGAVNNSNLTYTVTDAYQTGSTRVWLNGLLQRPNIEYTEFNAVAGTIKFYDAPLSGDQLWVCYTSSGF